MMILAKAYKTRADIYPTRYLKDKEESRGIVALMMLEIGFNGRFAESSNTCENQGCRERRCGKVDT